jgi:membrane associated rhomboid family serine protease
MPRSRYPSTSSLTYSFGPGPLTPAVKALLIANVGLFLLSIVVPAIILQFGLRPAAVFEQFAIWQPITYMFLHGGIGHILFNMLSLWMIGVELERTWGTKYFTHYYFASGIGAGITQMVLGIVPFAFANDFYYQSTIGASGAIFGLLIAYALYFPHRTFYMYFLFPIQARYFVMILGAITLLLALSGEGRGVAHSAHLGGLAAGYLYLRSGRFHPISELKYRYLKWRINRMRRKFDVYSGGRADDVNRRVH